MEQKRFLLPFTCDVNVKALHQVLQVARVHNATVVALALIPLAEQQQREDVRLEYIEQVQDFLAALFTQADIHSVRVEACELYTHNLLESINCYTQHLRCQRVLLSYEGEKVHFLHPHEAQQVRLSSSCPLQVLHTEQKKLERKGFLHALATQMAASF